MFGRGDRWQQRLILQQQQTISDLVDRLMHLAGHTWTLPEAPPFQDQDEDVPMYVSALDSIPEE